MVARTPAPASSRRRTVDKGWGHVFVAQGYQVVVPDWAGLGRSGYIPLAETSGEVIVAGLGEVLTALAGPAIVLTHSMSGAYGWKLLERHGERITKLIAVAPAPPGNIQKSAEIIGETVDAETIRLEGTTMAIARHSEQPIERAFIDHTLIGGSTLFPRKYASGPHSTCISEGICELVEQKVKAIGTHSTRLRRAKQTERKGV